MARPSADLYVQIPAYRDAELAPTLRSLYRNASGRHRLRVRVLWQYGDGDVLPRDVLRQPGLEVEAVAAADSEGCNWARQRLQATWRGEQYTALLDSHHRFTRDWDHVSIEMLEGLRDTGVRKPLLTAYLPAYDPARPACRQRRPNKIYPYRRDTGVLTRLQCQPIRHWRRLDAPIPADFLSLHFVLTDGRLNRDVEMDPTVYFFGDEVLTSVRVFAAGYRLFHPHRVLGWHAYDRARRVAHWADHDGFADRHRNTLVWLRRYFASPAAARFEAYTGVPLVIS